jgi:hypothetical protein
MKRVAVIPHAGLCNRMRAIASAIRIARKFEAEAVIYWKEKRKWAWLLIAAAVICMACVVLDFMLL